MTLNFVFLSFVFYRRLSRARHFAEKDAAKARYAQPIHDFAQGALSLEASVVMLEHARSSAEREAVQQLLIAEVNERNVQNIAKLLFALGFVERWAKAAFGPGKGQKLTKRSLSGETAMVDERPRWGAFAFLQRIRLTAVPR